MVQKIDISDFLGKLDSEKGKGFEKHFSPMKTTGDKFQMQIPEYSAELLEKCTKKVGDKTIIELPILYRESAKSEAKKAFFNATRFFLRDLNNAEINPSEYFSWIAQNTIDPMNMYYEFQQ
jgi:hypothetical protein